MSVLSGIQGMVEADVGSGIAAVTGVGKWSANPKNSVSEYASSATGQATDRIAGNDDWDGTYTQMSASPLIYPASQFNFHGAIDGTRGVNGTAIMDEFSLKVDIEGGKEIEHNVKFSGSYNLLPGLPLALLEFALNDSGEAFSDPIQQLVTSAVGCTAAICIPGSSTWYELRDVRTMDLTIKSATKAYHSSTTYSPTTGRNWAGRTPGNVDATCAVSLYNLPFELIPLKSVYGLRIYVTPPTRGGSAGWLNSSGYTNSLPMTPPAIPVLGTLTGGLFWEINWVIFQTYSGIEVDRKSPNIIGATINGGFKSTYNPNNGAATLGHILAPANIPGTTNMQWWPFASPSGVAPLV